MQSIGIRSKALAIVGIATCTFWMSKAVFPSIIPPLGPMPDFGGLVAEVAAAPPWIKEMVPPANRPASELESVLRNEFIRTLVWRWSLIVLGMAAGVLVLLRLRSGRWLALLLAILILVVNLRSQVSHAQEVGLDRLVEFWDMFFHRAPAVAARTVIDLAFGIFTVAFMVKRSTGEAFSNRPAIGRPEPAAG